MTKGYHSVFRQKYPSVFSDNFIKRSDRVFWYACNISSDKKHCRQQSNAFQFTYQHGTTWLHILNLKQPPESMERHPMSLGFPVKVINTGHGWQKEVACRYEFLVIHVRVCTRRVCVSWRGRVEVRERFLHKASPLFLMILHLIFFSHQNAGGIYSAMCLPCSVERNRFFLRPFFIPPLEG